ncbi:hypothetical protein [Gaoshiqia sp. Z1-71]|uniref:hypothetical protein n=1 Tax=Gaoshiqia hydrogeniformans TaxID=3290090 RepID=UPI003BF80240
MKGWISIHREIQEHWVWQNEKYLKWWLTIILNVNHEPKKFPVGTELHVCKPGQSFRSVEQWTDMFSCSKPTTLKFFEMLKNDGMIQTEIMGRGNRRKHLLTVVNWVKYQQMETGNFTETVPETLPKQNPNVPSNNNENNENNIPPNPQIRGNDGESLVWKKDFQTYLNELREAFKEITTNNKWIKRQETFNPGVDILKSIEKSCVNYWATEAGWKKKKDTRIKRIDWESTFGNAVSQPMNRVYKQDKPNNQIAGVKLPSI